ncbi:MAG: DNA repair protein RecN [Gemmatimonas sp.]
MLVELRIRNVAVIDTVILPLAGGLNVLTGETGAGKSLIIGALGMLLGERTAADRVRNGTEKASVEGVFDIRTQGALREMLDERGIEADDDLLVLKREVSSAGRSRAWVNGSTVTAAVLAEIGARLVSVHGQHDSRQLVDAEHQRDVLDAYVQATTVRQQVADAHARVLALRAREKELEQRRQDAMRRADYLRFVVREIEDVNPVLGEDEALDGDIRRLSHAEELQGLAAQAAAAISGDDRAALTQLAGVRRALASLTRIDPDLQRLQAGFDAAVYALDELATELEHYADTVEADPQRLRTLERRRDLLLGVLRKYGPTMEEVVATGATSRAELELVDSGTLDLAAISETRAAAEGALAEAAAELTRLRKNSSSYNIGFKPC